MNISVAMQGEHTEYDYAHVRKALSFISENWREQPGLEELSQHVGLSQSHLQRVVTRWAGISPKGFLQAVTLSSDGKEMASV